MLAFFFKFTKKIFYSERLLDIFNLLMLHLFLECVLQLCLFLSLSLSVFVSVYIFLSLSLQYTHIFYTLFVKDDYGSALLPEHPGGQDLAYLQGPGQRRNQDVRRPSSKVGLY